MAISIHAPLAGSNARICLAVQSADISIHAPLTGSDVQGGGNFRSGRNFNPRSPHGERPATSTAHVIPP